uniref:Uncharacterized protein n=1 Tax=Ditylenchus dipsaci TaxID=166011 RepID=A0A915CT84_9BILA
MGRSSANRPAPYPWSPYSPDITPCDEIKDQVYRTQPADLEELKQRIVHAFQELPPGIVQRAMNSYGRRFQRCIEVQGKSVEQEYGNIE